MDSHIWTTIGSSAVLAFIILIGAMIWLLFPASSGFTKWIYTIFLILLAVRLFWTTFKNSEK